MSNATPTQLLHYGIAVLSVALASLLTVVLQTLLTPANLALFYAAVAVSAWYGGMKAGIMATVLSTLSIYYFLIQPLYSASSSLSYLVPLGVFVLVTLLISSLNSKLNLAQRKAVRNLQALQASEERYRILAENVPQFVWNARPDGFMEYFNQQWYDCTGLTPDTSLGWEWQTVIHPDDLPSTLEAWNTAVSTKNTVEVQYRLKRADGIYRWYMTRALPLLNAGGEVVKWFGTCTDIHEQKQVEQERTALLEELESKQKLLEAVLQQMPAGLIVAEAKSCRLLLKNDRVQQILGEDLLECQQLKENRESHYQMFYPDGRAYKKEELPLARSLLHGDVVNAEEIELVCANGNRKNICADSSPIRNAEGQIMAAIVSFHDISDRKRIQKELQESNQTLSTLISASPLPIVVMEPDTTVRLWNPAAENLFGWSDVEVLGRLLPIIPEEKQEECRLVRQMLLGGETFFGVETYRCKRDGSAVYLSISAAPIGDESGKVNLMMFILQDISDRQQAEKALRESEERFRQLAETIQDVFWVWDISQDKILYVSPAYEQIWGRSCESVYDNKNWMETLHLEDRERVQSTFYSKIKPEKYDIEYRIIRPDRSIRWIRDRVFPVSDKSGKINCVIGVAEDITEGKIAQNALRDALQKLNFHVENSPLAVIEWDTDMQVTRWSTAAEKMFGWKAEELLGKQLGEWRFVYDEDLPLLDDISRRIFSGNEPQILSCNRNYTKNGDVIHCEWYNSTLTDESGNVVSVLSLVLNVTERHKAQQKLEQSEAKFRLMADSAPVFIWMTDKDGCFSYFNQPWLKFVGKGMKDAIATWKEGFHPEDLQSNWDKYLAAFQQQQPFEIEYRHRHADGEYRWILDKGVPLFIADNTFVGYIGSGIDITTRKRTEEETRSAFAFRTSSQGISRSHQPHQR